MNQFKQEELNLIKENTELKTKAESAELKLASKENKYKSLQSEFENKKNAEKEYTQKLSDLQQELMHLDAEYQGIKIKAENKQQECQYPQGMHSFDDSSDKNGYKMSLEVHNTPFTKEETKGSDLSTIQEDELELEYPISDIPSAEKPRSVQINHNESSTRVKRFKNYIKSDKISFCSNDSSTAVNLEFSENYIT